MIAHPPRSTKRKSWAASECKKRQAYGGPSAVGFNPTVFIDISDALDKKVQALMCHVSQAEASEKVSASWVRSTAEHSGFLCRRPFAEGFEPVRQVLDF